MFLFDNAVVTSIYTVNTVHVINELAQGHFGGVEFVAGSAGTTSAFADYGGTVSGTVKATSVGHGLLTGDIIAIENGANYKGVFTITVIDTDNFYFTATWVANDGVTNWQMADYFKVTKTGNILITSSFSVRPEVPNDVFIFQNYVNDVINPHARSEVKLKVAADLQLVSLTSIDPVVVGDRIWMSVQNITGAGDLYIKHANFSIVELI